MNYQSSNTHYTRKYIIIFLLGLIINNVSYADEDRIRIDQESLRIIPINSTKAKISGRIIEAADWVYYTYDGVWVLKDYMPSKIRISIPYRSGSFEADVLSDGQFSGYIELKSGYYFSRDPQINIEPGNTWWSSERKIEFSPERQNKPGEFHEPDKKSSKHNITLYYVDVYPGYAEKVLTKVRIEFVEKNSRVPVRPNIKIKITDGPTFESIKSEWQAKYKSSVVEKLVETHNTERSKLYKTTLGFLKKGNIRDIENKSFVEFGTYTGSTVSVETRDRNFYYFKGFINVNNPNENSNTVLLIEIGNKVRHDEEGHGGQIISE